MKAEEKHKRWTQQCDLAQIIIKKANINIVTCGSCGDVMLHERDLEEIKCPYCDFTSEPCDFPDFFHFRGIGDFTDDE